VIGTRLNLSRTPGTPLIGTLKEAPANTAVAIEEVEELKNMF